MRFPVFLRRTGGQGFKNPVKGLLIMVAAFDGNINHIHIRTDKQIFGMVDSERIDIGSKAYLKHVGKDSGKGKLSDSESVGDGIQADLLQKMIGNIGNDVTR